MDIQDAAWVHLGYLCDWLWRGVRDIGAGAWKTGSEVFVLGLVAPRVEKTHFIPQMGSPQWASSDTEPQCVREDKQRPATRV